MEEQVVYVVTNVELGWDCICGVFSTHEGVMNYFTEDQGYDLEGDTLDEINEIVGEDGFVVHKTSLK